MDYKYITEYLVRWMVADEVLKLTTAEDLHACTRAKRLT